MRTKLYSPQQAHKVLTELWPKIKSALISGHELEIEVTRKKRSQDQNEMMHAIIGRIAKQAHHLGATWSAEDWKRLLVHQWAKDTRRLGLEKIVPALDGGSIVQLGLQTRNMKVDEASEFTEWLIAWAAQNGVTLNEV